MPHPSNIGGALMGYPSTVDTGNVGHFAISAGSPEAGTAAALVANTTYLVGEEVRAQVTMTGVRYHATTASGNCQVGIYDINGNLLASSASTAVGSGVQTLNFTSSVILPPGLYFLAFWVDNATATLFRVNAAVTGLAPAWHVTATAGAIAASFTPASGLTIEQFRLCLTGIISGGLI